MAPLAAILRAEISGPVTYHVITFHASIPSLDYTKFSDKFLGGYADKISAPMFVAWCSKGQDSNTVCYTTRRFANLFLMTVLYVFLISRAGACVPLLSFSCDVISMIW